MARPSGASTADLPSRRIGKPSAFRRNRSGERVCCGLASTRLHRLANVLQAEGMRVGRNALCPCGSGKKFKKCHLNMPPIGATSAAPPQLPRAVTEKFARHRREEMLREANFGKIRPIIQVPEYAGKRIVVVRNRIYWQDKEKWKFFSDFLSDYSKLKFGKEWLEAQKAASPRDRHPLYVWQRQAYDWQQRQTPRPDGTYAEIPNGPMAACNNFYYDLYTVDDNALLDGDLLARLKHRDQFQGALHELFAQATCLRAGFDIIRENERDRNRRHVEFIAVHKATGQHILVEAKSRHRAGVMGRNGERDEKPDIRFRRLINDAITKDPGNPLAIFVDTNLPPRKAELFYEPGSRTPLRPSRAMASLMEVIRKEHGGVDPYNLLVFSNHPQHYSEGDEIAPGNRWAGIISQKARVPVHHLSALQDLFTAANMYGNVPTQLPRAKTVTAFAIILLTSILPSALCKGHLGGDRTRLLPVSRLVTANPP